jgi:hypothetical protein
MKAWLADSQRGKVKLTAGEKTLGYGKENAVSITEAELEGLKEIAPEGVVIQTDKSSGSSSGSGGEGDSAS